MSIIEIINQQLVVLDNTPVGAFLLSKDYKVFFWNNQLETWTKISKKEIVGLYISVYFPHLKKPRYSNRLQGIFEGGPPAIFSSQLHKQIIPCVLSNGEKRIQRTTVSPIKFDEFKEYFALFVIQDVTELSKVANNFRSMRDQALAEVEIRKQTEEKLKEHRDHLDDLVKARTIELTSINERLKQEIIEHKITEMKLNEAKLAAEAANIVKSQFLANMSHELRTPMNGIIGMTDLVLQSSLVNEHREHLNMVMSSAKSLMILINDLLDFAKIEIGKLELTKKPFNLNTYLNEIIEMFSICANKKAIKLYADIDKDLPNNLIGDPDRLRQVIINILDNAVKFTDKGEIHFKVEVSKDKNKNLSLSNVVTIYFAISDTGIGIPVNKIDYIFNSFTQIDGSFSRKYGGTGLGLTISRKIINMLDGNIWVESELSKGSTFHFTVNLGLANS